jgi:hypothetical protein
MAEEVFQVMCSDNKRYRYSQVDAKMFHVSIALVYSVE